MPDHPLALEREVATIFQEVLHISVPAADTDLLATGLLDSLGFVDLILQLEERFGIRVAMESLEPDDFRSIASIAAFVTWQRDGRLPTARPVLPDVPPPHSPGSESLVSLSGGHRP